MLRSISRPGIAYDLLGLGAVDGIVSVGRETDALIRLDSPDVPYLLSRKHACIDFQPDGSVTLRDLESTNGTYMARRGQPLRKLQSGTSWKLMEGDTVGFGGPESIMARRVSVSNPFLFKFYTSNNQASAAEDQLGQQQQSPETIDLVSPPPPDPTATLRATSIPFNLMASTVHLQSSPIHAPLAGKENRPSVAPSTPTSKKMTDILASHLTCPVCQEWLVACHMLSCGHMFCGLCLATWLNQKPTCPTCRKPTGMPVRCFQVDNTINDLLGVNVMSPNAKNDRKWRQTHWEEVQQAVLVDWGKLCRRREQALQAANRQYQDMMGAPAAPPPQSGGNQGTSAEVAGVRPASRVGTAMQGGVAGRSR